VHRYLLPDSDLFFVRSVLRFCENIGPGSKTLRTAGKGEPEGEFSSRDDSASIEMFVLAFLTES
jgi:hypothetical protein